MVVWIDKNWLKPLLVNKNEAQIQAADEIEDIIQEIMEEDPLDNQNGADGGSRDVTREFFLSMSHEYLRSQANNLSQVNVGAAYAAGAHGH